MKKALILATVPSMIQQFNMNNIKILKELGYKVEVAANFQDGGTIDSNTVKTLKKILDTMNVKYYDIPFARSPFSSKNLKAYRETKKVIIENKYELIHLHSPIGGVCGRLAAKRLRKKGKTKVIYTAHGFHFYKGAPLLNWMVYYPVEKILARITDSLITINSEDYQIAKKRFKAKNIELVHGVGVDKRKFDITLSAEKKESIRNKIGLTKNDFVIIQIAELNENKNQAMLIDTMKELVKEDSSYKAILVGRGNLEQEYRAKIESYGLQNNVFLLGYREDVPELLKISDCLVALSYREGLGLNVVEAICSRVPIIATKNRGHKELVEDDFMIEVNDCEKLKQMIIKIRNREVADEIIVKNYAKIEKFDIKNINNIMKDIYLKG